MVTVPDDVMEVTVSPPKDTAIFEPIIPPLPEKLVIN
jgi:hypothetical protein